MKIIPSTKICAFGGLNVIHHELEKLNLGDFLQEQLPILPNQSIYNWKDVFYSLLSIYYCGGDRIEDAKTVLRNHFSKSPFFNLCSPDTLLRRIQDLASHNDYCQTKRGKVVNEYNYNELLSNLNIGLLNKLGVFNSNELVLDYDNTIIFNRKKDSRMTYKKDYGYQPGICFINERNVLYVENRNGNCGAMSFQADTLTRMFTLLESNGAPCIDKFRADSASYQYDVIRLLNDKSIQFYISAKVSYVENYFSQIDNWESTTDSLGQEMQIGSTEYIPFSRRYEKTEKPVKYRLLVRKKLKKQGQINLFTENAHSYSAVITNDFDCKVERGLQFYADRGRVEREFDVLKNDFGWSCLPFSNLAPNTAFLYLTALCRNLYSLIVSKLSSRFKGINPKGRMKRLIFSFITIPSKWIKQSRVWKLKIFGHLPLRI